TLFRSEVEAASLPVFDTGLGVEQVGAADQVLELLDAHLGHIAANFLGDEEEVVDHMLGLPRKALTQYRILRGDTDRAGIEVALAHHQDRKSTRLNSSHVKISYGV